MNLVFGLLCIIASGCILFLKYRVVLKGEKCKATIVDLVNQDCGYAVGGVQAKKHAYVVQIKRKNYVTAHGCLLPSRGKRQIGKEILVFKSEKYGREVYKCYDFRIEIIALVLLLLAVFFFVFI